MGFDHNIAPQLRRLKHIGLVHRAEFLAARHGGFKTDAGDAAHLILIIRHDVIAFPLAIGGFAHAFFPKIDVAVQFADDDHVDLCGHLWPKRTCVGKLGKQGSWAQVGEQSQFLAQAQDRLFRAQMAFQRVAIGVAHGAKQNRVGALGEGQRIRRQRMARRLIGRTTDERFFKRQSIYAQRIQHAPSFGNDFRADSVPG